MARTLEPIAFPPEAKAFEKTLRPKIASIGPGEHSLHRELRKRVLHHRPNRLRRIPLALMGRRKRESKLGFAGAGGAGAKSNVPNQSGRGCGTHCELKPGARRPRREVLQARDELAAPR